jgi:hypothetical protein
MKKSVDLMMADDLRAQAATRRDHEKKELERENARLRSELSAAKEAEAAALLAAAAVREQAAALVYAALCLRLRDKDAASATAMLVRDLPLPLSPTPTVEKVRRLVEAADKAMGEMCNTPVPRDSFTDAVNELDAALSEVEALIRTQEEK